MSRKDNQKNAGDLDFPSSLPGAEDEEIIIISKTQQKRDAHALTDLGKTLVDLSEAELAKLPLDDELAGCVLSAREMKMGARKRQLQFIGKLLRKRDTSEIQKGVDDILHARSSKGQAFKALEKWRNRLLTEGNDALTAFCSAYPNTDVQRIRQLIRNANKEQSQGKPPKAFRELFKEIRRLDEENQT